jgi:hypothetical protein
MFGNLILGLIHDIGLVKSLHSCLIDVLVLHLLVLHGRWSVGVHVDLLLLLHIHSLAVGVLMHSLWRVKAICMDRLVVLVQLIWHLHMLIHVHLGLVLHLCIRMHNTHLLVLHVLVLNLVLLSVL